MSEERAYGLEDGYGDAERGDPPAHKLDVEHDDEYEAAYVEGYQQALSEKQDV